MTKAAEWAGRVKQWRASGMRSKEFCEERGYSATNLLWWSSHFRRNGFPAASAASGSVTLARVVRRAEVAERSAPRGAARAVVIELAGARIAVDAGADRATVAMVLDVLRSHASGAER
jgi:hypothetical protein